MAVARTIVTRKHKISLDKLITVHHGSVFRCLLTKTIEKNDAAFKCCNDGRKTSSSVVLFTTLTLRMSNEHVALYHCCMYDKHIGHRPCSSLGIEWITAELLSYHNSDTTKAVYRLDLKFEFLDKYLQLTTYYSYQIFCS